MLKVIANYSEIGLKGKNKSFFEKKLIFNIKENSKKYDLEISLIKKEGSRIIVNFNSENKEKISFVLKHTFGIKSFAFTTQIKKDLNSILDFVRKKLIDLKLNDKNDLKFIAFEVTRNDKNFELNSIQLKSKLGEIAHELGIKVDYKNSENSINILITMNNVFIFYNSEKGYGGLAVGSSGRVLVLLSGGIDSPIAAWNMMRRGIKCDFLHFHTYLKNEEVLNTKIKSTIEILNQYQLRSRLYLVPYSPYEFLTSGKIYENYELVFFKHYLLKVAQKIARENRYDAIVNGDNIAQVASQTIENLNVSQTNIDILIFRPLLCFEKEEIISRAKEIGTFELSIKEYKDCCSLFAKNPATKANLAKFNKILMNVDIAKIVEKSILEMQVFDID